MQTLFDAEAREASCRAWTGCPLTASRCGAGRTRTAQLHAAPGELKCDSKKTPMNNWLMRHLIIYWMPWPRGSPTAPASLAQPTTPWNEDLAALRPAIHRFGARGEGDQWPQHPAFGPLTGRRWRVLAWRHPGTPPAPIRRLIPS
ncbi:MAG TPA: hypothetical protein VHG93_16760 [Longimicrobium sp.]|nr:hypothetical protein [Longimicrobium sp.]